MKAANLKIGIHIALSFLANGVDTFSLFFPFSTIVKCVQYTKNEHKKTLKNDEKTDRLGASGYKNNVVVFHVFSFGLLDPANVKILRKTKIQPNFGLSSKITRKA